MTHWHNPALNDFFVVTVISNPVRYKRRYELYDRFVKMCESAGINLITVEQAFGDRPWMVTQSQNPMHLQVRSSEELWLKENMINLGIAHGKKIIPEAKYVAWVDADCAAARSPRDWFEETWHELQHYEFVQMWESMIDLDHYFQPQGPAQPGFMANYIKYGTPNPLEFKALQDKNSGYPYGSSLFGRPGLAWAAAIDSINKVGGLYQGSILGAGDWYMAHSLVGSADSIVGPHMGTQAYYNQILEWQTRAERWIKRDVGYVRGMVYHYFHGNKVKRFYGSRGKILVDNKYDPNTDIKPDSHGLLQLETWEPRQLKLRDQIRAYFRARDEDALS